MAIQAGSFVPVVHKNIILAIVALAQFMVILDVSIINVALPTIFRGLHYTSTSSLQWIVTAYTLLFGGFLLLGGRVADLYGRKRVFISAALAFAVASLLGGLAQNETWIEVTRGLQGLSAAFMSPAALSILITTFSEGRERTKALSVWGAVAASGAAVGLLLGGVLTQYLSWRWNFFVNVPVTIFVALMALRYIPESRADLGHRQLDLPGAILTTSGLILLVYGFTRAPTYGWTSFKTLGFLLSGIVLLILFVINERRSRHPLMPLSIFRISNVAAANLTQMPITAALFSMFFFVTLYVQNILGYSPIKAGLSFLPVPIVIGIISTLMARVIGKIGYKIPMTLAPLFLAGGLLYLTNISIDGSYLTQILPGIVITAIGLGMGFVSITIAATNGVPARESGLASGLLNTSQQIGGSIGLAVLSGVYAAGVKSYLSANASTASNPFVQAQASVLGSQVAFGIGVIFALTAFFSALLFVQNFKAEVAAPAAALPESTP